MRRLVSIGSLACLWCSTLIGCQGTGFYKVVGEASLDGEPIKEGDITFSSDDPHIAPEAGKIVNGHYEIMAKPGMKKVDIRAARLSPTVKNAFGAPLSENIIPARYNTATELTADVQASDKNRFDFVLKGEPAK
ncbi:MAG: hypothetical protein K8U57_12580 [Planctomycetes bacterium]|nr:hypothetical protein [Planctomycetota bacterium]